MEKKVNFRETVLIRNTTRTCGIVPNLDLLIHETQHTRRAVYMYISSSSALTTSIRVFLIRRTKTL
jgi:hypothetical protein